MESHQSHQSHLLFSLISFLSPLSHLHLLTTPCFEIASIYSLGAGTGSGSGSDSGTRWLQSELLAPAHRFECRDSTRKTSGPECPVGDQSGPAVSLPPQSAWHHSTHRGLSHSLPSLPQVDRQTSNLMRTQTSRLTSKGPKHNLDLCMAPRCFFFLLARLLRRHHV